VGVRGGPQGRADRAGVDGDRSCGVRGHELRPLWHADRLGDGDRLGPAPDARAPVRAPVRRSAPRAVRRPRIQGGTGPRRGFREIFRTVVAGFGARLGFAPPGDEVEGPVESLPAWRPSPDTVDALRILKRRFGIAGISNIDDGPVRAVRNAPGGDGRLGHHAAAGWSRQAVAGAVQARPCSMRRPAGAGRACRPESVSRYRASDDAGPVRRLDRSPAREGGHRRDARRIRSPRSRRARPEDTGGVGRRSRALLTDGGRRRGAAGPIRPS